MKTDYCNCCHGDGCIACGWTGYECGDYKKFDLPNGALNPPPEVNGGLKAKVEYVVALPFYGVSIITAFVLRLFGRI